jgi:DNA sulfur modification protein DndB
MAQPKWKKLERQLYRFVSKQLGADHFDGGPKCIVAGYQIDAYGIFANTALVFECKTGRKVNLKHAIDRLAGGRSAIRKELQKLHGKNVKTFRFVVVVGNADEIAKHARRSRTPKDIITWTPKYFQSVRNLAKAINRRALPYILRELRIKNIRQALGMPRKPLTVPALRILQGANKRKGIIYSFFAPVRAFLDYGYVARLESDLPDAYQRLLHGSRLHAIRDYIESGNSFKNSVVISLPEKAKFKRRINTAMPGSKRKIEMGLLRIPPEPASLWIIDGQHRIYGYAEVKNQTVPLAAIGIQHMSVFEQGKVFVDINKNQKPVDPNRLWDLYFHLTPQEATGIISGLVKDISSDRHSMLHEKIYIPSASQRARRDYKIYMANVCEAIVKQRLIQIALNFAPKTQLEDINSTPLKRGAKRVHERLNTLYRSVKLICKELGHSKWWTRFFLSNNGISIMLRVLRELLPYKKAGSTQASYVAILKKPLSNYFSIMEARLDEMLKVTSSEGGRESIAVAILTHINALEKDFAVEKLRAARRIVADDLFYKTVGLFEKSVRQVIQTELRALSHNWWEDYIPLAVKDVVNQKWAKKDKQGDRMDCLDISDYMRIFSHNWKASFAGHYAKIKKDKNWLNLKLQELTELRNKYFHFHGSIVPSERDTTRLGLLVEDILSPFEVVKAVVAQAA